MKSGTIPRLPLCNPLRHQSLTDTPHYVFRFNTCVIPRFPWIRRGRRVHLPIYSPFITSLSGVKGHRWPKHWTNRSPRESCNISTARGRAVFQAPNSTWDWPGFIVVSPKVSVPHLVGSIVSLLCTFDIHKIHKGCNTPLWTALSQNFNTLHTAIPEMETKRKLHIHRPRIENVPVFNQQACKWHWLWRQDIMITNQRPQIRGELSELKSTSNWLYWMITFGNTWIKRKF